MKKTIYACIEECGGIEVCRMSTRSDYFLAREFASIIADDIRNGSNEIAPELVLSELRTLSDLLEDRQGTLAHKIHKVSKESDRRFNKGFSVEWVDIYILMCTFLDTNFYGKFECFEY